MFHSLFLFQSLTTFTSECQLSHDTIEHSGCDTTSKNMSHDSRTGLQSAPCAVSLIASNIKTKHEKIGVNEARANNLPLYELNHFNERQERFLSPFSTNTTITTNSNLSSIKLGLTRVSASLDGKSFLSHRLRLEALEKRSAASVESQQSVNLVLNGANEESKISLNKINTHSNDLFDDLSTNSQKLPANRFLELNEVNEVLTGTTTNASNCHTKLDKGKSRIAKLVLNSTV